jgi:hypothetical protein
VPGVSTVLVSISPPNAITYATFAFADPSLTLSADFSRVTNLGVGAGCARSNMPKTAGNWRGTIVAGVPAGANVVVGIIAASAGTATAPGAVHGVGLSNNGQVRVAGTIAHTIGALPTRYVVEIYLRAATGRVWIRADGGAWIGGGDPVADTTPTAILGPSTGYVLAASTLGSVQGFATIATRGLEIVGDPVGGFSVWSVTTPPLYFLSSHGYSTLPSDSPASVHASGRLINEPEWERKLSAVIWPDLSQRAAFGSIDFAAADGELDSWPALTWRGQSAQILVGELGASLASFRELARASVDRLQIIADQRVQLVFADQAANLDKSLPFTAYPVTTPVVELRGKPQPQLFGDVPFAPLTLTDDAALYYRTHDETPNAVVDVYDNGVLLTLGAEYAIPNEIERLTAPAGKQVATLSSTYGNKFADVIQELVRRGGISASQIDSGSAQLVTDEFPAVLGDWFGSPPTPREIINRACRSVGAAWSVNPSGLIVFQRLKTPALTPVETLVWPQDFIGDTAFEEDPAKGLSLRLVGSRNHAPHSENEIAGIVTLAFAERLRQEWGFTVTAGTSVHSEYSAEATAADPIETMLQNSADGQTLIDFYANLYSVKRRIFRGTFAPRREVQLGSTYKIFHPRFGLNAGVNAIVRALRTSALSETIEAEFWF